MQSVLKSGVLIAPPPKIDHVCLQSVQLEVKENRVHDRLAMHAIAT